MPSPTPATWASGFVDASDFNTELRDAIDWIFDLPRILVGRSTNQNVTNQSYHTLTWNTDIFKVGFTHVTTGTDARMLTVQTAGLYLVFVNVEFSGATVTGQRRIDLSLNGAAGPTGNSNVPAGSTVFGTQNTPGIATTVPDRMSACGIFEAAVGDFFQVLCYQSSGSTIEVMADWSTFGAIFLADRV